MLSFQVVVLYDCSCFCRFQDDVLKIHPVQKMTSAGQTNRFVCYVLVGDTNGQIGLGSKCAKEVPWSSLSFTVAKKRSSSFEAQ